MIASPAGNAPPVVQAPHPDATTVKPLGKTNDAASSCTMTSYVPASSVAGTVASAAPSFCTSTSVVVAEPTRKPTPSTKPPPVMVTRVSSPATACAGLMLEMNSPPCRMSRR